MQGTATAKLRRNSKNIVDLNAQHFTEGMVELPRINYKYNGKPYSYFYGLGETKKAETYEFGMDIVSI